MKRFSKKNGIFCSFFCWLLLPTVHLQATCSQPDKHHADSNITRCLYKQEDIRRALESNKKRYQEMGIADACFYCGCSITEHTKKEAAE